MATDAIMVPAARKLPYRQRRNALTIRALGSVTFRSKGVSDRDDLDCRTNARHIGKSAVARDQHPVNGFG